jgi:hypothetical protein
VSGRKSIGSCAFPLARAELVERGIEALRSWSEPHWHCRQSYRRDVELCAHYDRDNMKELTVSLAVGVVMAGFVFAQDANKSQEPVTVSKALELGEEGLTQYTGLSEVGQDEAAEYYATAKRLTTEQALGQKSLQLVIDLQNWRDLISACRKSIDSLAYIVNGGGTMYSHGQRRDVSAVETFLAEFSKSLPLPDDKGDPNAEKVIDRTIALIKNLHAERDRKNELAERVKRANEDWTNLKHMVDEIPAPDAKKIVMFATGDVSGWLLDDNEEGKKFEAFREILKK